MGLMLVLVLALVAAAAALEAPCSYLRYCNFCHECRLCDDSVKGCKRPDVAERPPNCHSCKYCSYCRLCDPVRSVCNKLGGLGSWGDTLASLGGTIASPFVRLFGGDLPSDVPSHDEIKKDIKKIRNLRDPEFQDELSPC